MVGSPEYSLAIPTVIIHAAIGAVIFLALAKMAAGAFFATPAGAWLEKTVVLTSFLAAGAAMLAALGHLSYPLGAWLMPIAHLGSSWLSRESLFYGVFMLVMLIYSVGLLRGGPSGAPLAQAAAAVGLLAVFSCGMIYSTMGAIPAWNSTLTVLLFLAVSLLLGAAAFALPASMSVGSLPEGEGKQAGAAALRPAIAALPALFIAVLLIAGLMAVSSGGASGGAFWARILVGIAAPLPLAFIMLGQVKKNNPGGIVPYAFGVFAMALVGEIMGRVLFFAAASQLATGGAGTPY